MLARTHTVTDSHTRGLLLSVGTWERSVERYIASELAYTHPLHNDIILKVLDTVRGREEEEAKINTPQG